MRISLHNFLTKYFILTMLAIGASPAFAQMSLSVTIAPPPLEEYSQPACPDDGYLWTPGYWAYGDDGYYWVPGAWVQPPEVGDLWTPPYWGWNGDAYVFYPGYWGQDVGYYGGIDYGYGYGGHGYQGGRWDRGHFSYNTAVNNVDSTRIHNSYADRTALNNNSARVSYNGGKGGVQAQPTAHERQLSTQHQAQPSAPDRQFSTDRQTQPAAAPQSEPTLHSDATIKQKAEPQQEVPQEQQPVRQQQESQQPAPQQDHSQQKQDVHPSQQAQQQSHDDKTSAAKQDNQGGSDHSNGPSNGSNHSSNH